MFPSLLSRLRLHSASEVPGSVFVFLRRASARFVFSLWPGLLCLSLLLALAAPAAAQTVSFSSPDYPVWEGDAAKLDVVLSAPRTAATTVTFQTFGITATSQNNVDYIDQRYTVTIPAGHPRATLTIRTVEDDEKEDTESFQVLVFDIVPDIVLSSGPPAIVHIQDDDQDAGSIPQLQISRYGKYVSGQAGTGYAPVVEGTAASFTLTVSTDWVSPAPLAVTLKVSEDASEGQDFVSSTNGGTHTINIDPWRDGAAKIYSVPTKTGGNAGPDGAVTVTLAPTSAYTVDPGHYQATVEVADDDHPRGLILYSSTSMFGGLTMPEGGGGGYTVRLAAPPSATVNVSITRRNDGDGDGNWNNVRLSRTSLTFTTDNWHVPQGIDVFSSSDADKNNDRFSLVHSASGGGYGGISDVMRIGVVERDEPVGQDSEHDELPLGQGSDKDNVVVPSQPTAAVSSVQVAAVDAANARVTWDAVEHATSYLVEYETTSVLLDQQNYVQAVVDGWTQTSWTFQHDAAEAMTLTVTITPLYDDGNGNVQQFDDLAGTATIDVAPDPAPVATFASAAYSGGEAAGSRTVNAQVNVSPAAPSGGLSVAYAVNSSSTAGSSDYASLSGSLNIAQGQTSGNITVTITDDALDEGAETLILDLTDGADYDLGATPQTTITIADDDETAPPPPPPPPATPVASFASASASAAESAGTQNVTVNLNPAPPANITLNYTLSGTATRDADYSISGVTSNSGTANVSGGDTSVNIPVAIADDSADEPSETVILTLTSGTGYDVGGANVHTLTITDNDDAGGGGGGGGGTGGGGGDGDGDGGTGGGDDDEASRVTLSVSPNPVVEGEEITVTVGLSRLVASDIDIPLILTPGDAEAGDYGALASIVIAANDPNGMGVIATMADEDLDDETFTVALGTLPSGLEAGAQASVQVTITDATGVTSIESLGGEIPEAFALEQNYPNPFNPTTTIEFALDKTQRVTLSVYDLLGQEVQVLVNGVRPAARYRVPFDATELASGTYLYVLRTEEQVAVKTMALLK